MGWWTDLCADVKAALRSLKEPEHAVVLAVLVGFFVWGHEGKPWIIPWDDLGLSKVTEWELAFGVGALFMVVVPFVVGRALGLRASELGLGLGTRPKEGAVWAAVGVLLALPLMYFAADDEAMRRTYPLPGADAFGSHGAFAAYELCYGLFFLANEVGMRGLLLFAVKRRSNPTMAVLVAAIPQVVWHLDKPTSEVLLAFPWGLFIGALTVRLGSVWYAFVFHWLANVWLDVVIYSGWW